MASYVDNDTMRLSIALNFQYINEGLLLIDVSASSSIAYLAYLIHYMATYNPQYSRLSNIDLNRMALWRVVFPYRTFYPRVQHEAVVLYALANT
ncbi:hypothetical protein BGW39_001667, partial [Mortierella sp. 14UC]